MTFSELPTNDASDSEQRSANPPSGSVYDFLYHDARRVGSFLSQFETYGVPSQVKATESSGRGASKRTSASGEAGVPMVAKGQTSLDWTTNVDDREIAERTYDPLWANARRLLDYLAEQDLIQRDLWAARLGQFVLVSGSLVMLDVATFKEAWQKPGVKQFVMASAQGGVPAVPGQQKSAQHAAKEKAKSEAGLLIELLAVLPHLIQAQLFAQRFSVWCTLAEASLVGPSSDVVLKHGAYVQGQWSLLGILDADPDVPRAQAEGEPPTQSIDELVADMIPSGIGKMTAQLAPLTRTLLGRPRTSFGVTPLLIFREVTG